MNRQDLDALQAAQDDLLTYAASWDTTAQTARHAAGSTYALAA